MPVDSMRRPWAEVSVAFREPEQHTRGLGRVSGGGGECGESPGLRLQAQEGAAYTTPPTAPLRFAVPDGEDRGVLAANLECPVDVVEVEDGGYLVVTSEDVSMHYVRPEGSDRQ